MRRSMAWHFTADLALERAAMKPIFDQFFETLLERGLGVWELGILFG